MSISLIVGDLHLGKGQNIGKPGVNGVPNSRIVDQLHLLDWILERAIEINATRIFLTGDIFEDAKPDYTFLNFLIAWIKKAEVYQIDIYAVLGNHDLKRHGDRLNSVLDVLVSSELPNFHFYKEIGTVYLDNVGITLLPYRDRRVFNSTSNSECIEKIRDWIKFEVNAIPKNYHKVLIGHLALEGSLYVGDEIDDSVNELIMPLSVFKDYDFVWMGHVHKPQVLNELPHIAHIGSLDLSNFGETDHQKIIIVLDTDDGNCKFGSIQVPSRPLKHVSIKIPSDCVNSTEFVISEIGKISDLKDALVKLDIKLEGHETPNTNREQISKALYDAGVYYISYFVESRNVSVVSVEKRNTELTSTVEPKVAVKMYAEVLGLNEVERTDFIADCLEIIESFVDG